MAMAAETCLTLEFKRLANIPFALDVYLPASSSQNCPLVVYFHGGGLTVGGRNSWFPTWMKDRALKAGFAFLTAEYRLLPPSTGHDIVEDVKDLFNYVNEQLNHDLQCHNVSIDPQRIAASGSSAGGLCAYYAGLHANPKPRVILSMYGMGGNFISSHYLSSKNKPFFRGRELLDPAHMSEFLYPQSSLLPVTIDAPLEYLKEPSIFPLDNPTHPTAMKVPAGFPKEKRMLLIRFYMQLGRWIDYYTGQHEPSLSSQLRQTLRGDFDTTPSRLKHLIPEIHHDIFPQLMITSDFPPTFFIHGIGDTAVSVDETRNMAKLLHEANVEHVVHELENTEHSFDYEPDAHEKHHLLFNEAYDFLKEHLGKSR